MDMIREYLLRLTATAMICGVSVRLCGNPAVRRCVKLCCGICMLLITLTPLLCIDTSQLARSFLRLDFDVDAMLAGAQNHTQEQMAECISASAAEYILDKVPGANGIGIEVQTQEISEFFCVPSGVTFRGTVDSALKVELTQILRDDLGLTEEQIQWIPE